MLTNPFTQGKNLAQDSSSTSMHGGSQGAPTHNTNNWVTNIYMMKVEANIYTMAHKYRTPEFVKKGKEASNPLTPLQIEKTVGETMTRIPKGVFKKDSHNLNARVSQNYSIMEDLAQTPCAMFTLEVI
jgi:hypothetical protein